MGEVAIISGGGKPISSFWGDGSDGDFNPTANYQFTVPALDLYPVIKQYRSINIPAGVTVSVGTPDNGSNAGAGRNKGLILFCQGDCAITGTVNQNLKAPLYDANNVFSPLLAAKHVKQNPDISQGILLNPAYQALLLGVGGKGGDGGYLPGLSGASAALAGAGTEFGGGYGAGGNSGTGSSTANGGGTINIPVGTSMPYPGTVPETPARYGAGGGARAQYSGFMGGAGPGGSGAGAVGQGGINGSPGNAYGGGLIIIVCGGNLTISGTLTANGGNGAVASTSYSAGSGGGGGGGIITLLYNGNYQNTGTLTVNAGTAGAAAVNCAGQPGGLGSIKAAQFTRG